jgi:hypothetical protein
MAVDDECRHGLIKTQATKRHKRRKGETPVRSTRSKQD